MADSLSTYLFRNYFVMLAKAGVQAAIDRMNLYEYEVASGDTLETIALFDYSVTSSDTLSGLATTFGVSTDELYAVNPDLDQILEQQSGTIKIPVDVTAEAIVKANQGTAGLLNPGKTLTLTGVSYQVHDGDTIANQAALYGISAEELITAIELPDNVLLDGDEVFQQGTLLEDSLTVVGNSGLTSFLTAYSDREDSRERFRGYLAEWNSELDLDNLSGNTTLQVKYHYTLEGIYYYYYHADSSGFSKADFLAKNETNDALLAPLDTITLFYAIHTITAEDSFGSIAAYYNLSLTGLAAQVEAEADLFFISSDADTKNAVITIPDVPVANVRTLKEKILQSGGFNNIASMSSAYMLGGLRLPKPAETGGQTDTSRTYPLYTLTGQQFEASQAASLKLVDRIDQPWLSFESDSGSDSAELEVTLDAAEKEFLAAITFAPTIYRSGSLPLYTYLPERHALSRQYAWHSDAWPDLACLRDDNGAITLAAGTPDIWMLSASLVSQIKDLSESDSDKLLYELVTNCYEDLSDPNQTKNVESCCFATALDLTIRQITGGTDPAAYLLEGTNEKGLRPLLQLRNHLKDNTGTEEYTLYLLYEDTDAGYVSQTLDTAQTFILKANLAVESYRITADDASGSTGLYAAPVDQPADFLDLLWECSVVKSGGYYLHYGYDDGLPDTIFSDQESGRLVLLVVAKSQNLRFGRKLLPFNNCVVVTDNIDTDSSQLAIQPLTHLTGLDETLDTIIANAEYDQIRDELSAANLVTANSDIRGILKPGAEVEGHTLSYTDTFTSLADALSTDLTGLAAIIAAEPVLEADRLIQFSRDAMVMSSTVAPGNAGFQVIRCNPEDEDYSTAAASLASLEQVAVANKDTPYFFPDDTSLPLDSTYTYRSTIAGLSDQGGFQTVAEFAAANSGITLAAGVALNVNGETYTTGSNDTLASIAADVDGLTVGTLATANQNVENLYPDSATLQSSDGTFVFATTLQDILSQVLGRTATDEDIEASASSLAELSPAAGTVVSCAGVSVTATGSESLTELAVTMQASLDQSLLEFYERFHLLGFKITPNDYFAGSFEGLPLSPALKTT